MNKLFAFLSVAVVALLNLLQTVAPILPPVWSNLISGVLGVFAFYHVFQSHSQAALAQAGYTKVA